MIIFSGHWKLSVIERCSHYRGVRTERFDCSNDNYHKKTTIIIIIIINGSAIPITSLYIIFLTRFHFRSSC